MSAFYDQASLVVVPSGYKSGKIYAQKPLTTDGQLTFTRASTATRVNASGLIEEVASGVPRLDYLGSSCPKILLEPQRSNIALRSNAVATGPWQNFGGTVTNNSGISPDGTNNATILESNASGPAGVYQTISATSGQTITVSMYVKLGTATNFCLVINNAAAWNTVGGQVFTTADGLSTTAWKRISFSFTSPASNQFNIHIGLHAQSGLAAQSLGSYYVYGVQAEIGAYMTSLIPTTTATVTRLADFVSKTFPFMSSSGYTSTFFIEFDGPLEPGTIDQIRWYPSADLAARFWIYTNVIGSAAAPLGYAFDKNNLKHKIIFRVENSTSISIFYNGAKVASSTSATISANFDTVEITGALLERGAKLAQMLAFSSSLNDAKCVELTTL
jgi:hypothetical protein